MQICSIAWIKVLNFINKEDTSQSLYTNTLYFIYLSSCDDKYRFQTKGNADLLPTENLVLEKMTPSTSLIIPTKWTSCWMTKESKPTVFKFNCTVARYSEEALTILGEYQPGSRLSASAH